jgi:WD40 repeat protein
MYQEKSERGGEFPRGVAFSPDGCTAATGLCESAREDDQCTAGAVWLWNLHTGTLIKKLADFPDWVQGVAFSRDGSLLIAGSREGTLRAYATSDFQPMLVTTSSRG